MPHSSFRLDGKRALVTSAGRGISLAAAAKTWHAGGGRRHLAARKSELRAMPQTATARQGGRCEPWSWT